MSKKEILIQIFAGIVLALAICTLTEKVRSILPVSRAIALLISLLGILMIFSFNLIAEGNPTSRKLRVPGYSGLLNIQHEQPDRQLRFFRDLIK